MALRIRVPPGEVGRPATLTRDPLDADGHTILPDPPGTIHGTLDVARPPHLTPGDDRVIPLALSINNLRFAVPGLHCHLNGTAMARAPFRVTHASTAQSGGAQGWVGAQTIRATPRFTEAMRLHTALPLPRPPHPPAS